MLATLRQNLAAMVLAVTLSFLLWTVAVSQQNPDRTDLLSQTLTIRPEHLPPELVLWNPLGLPEVRVRITAPSDLFIRLRLSSFRAVVDLSGAVPGTRRYPVLVETPDRRVRVVSWDPDQVTLTIEPFTRKDLPVSVSLDSEVPFGYVSREPRVVPKTLTVAGPGSLVDTVTAVTVNLGLANERTTHSAELAPLPRAADGSPVRGVTLAPPRVRVEVPIEQQAAYKAVPVVPAVIGAPRLGYQAIGAAVDPTSVTVVGEPGMVQSLQFVQTEPVDLNGATGDMFQSVKARLPSGVSLVRDQLFTVRIQVAPVAGSQVMRVAPMLANLGERLRATVDPGAIEVRISGPMPALLAVQPRDIRVVADLAQLGSGSYSVPLKVEVPSALSVERIDPERVLVTLGSSQ